MVPTQLSHGGGDGRSGRVRVPARRGRDLLGYQEENSHASALPLIGNPALEPHTAFALAAFTDATLPRTKLADCARTCGHSSKHIEYQVAEIARILRERLNTTEGQLRLALLFRSKEVPVIQRAEPILHRPDLGQSEKNGSS